MKSLLRKMTSMDMAKSGNFASSMNVIQTQKNNGMNSEAY